MKAIGKFLGVVGLGLAAGYLAGAIYELSNRREISSIDEIDYEKAFKRDVDGDGIEDVIVNRGEKNEYVIDGRAFVSLRPDCWYIEGGKWRRK